MIKFEATVVITPLALKEIQERVTEYVMKSIIIHDFDNDQLEIVNDSIKNSFALLVQENQKPNTFGYTLEPKEVLNIAGELRAERRIKAIKMFREATNAGLRESKNLIDQFSCGKGSAELFIETFM